MHDLDSRLERLAAGATREAVPPEPAAIARRGRRRRRRQLAASALVVAAVVAGGLVLPARLAGRAGGDNPAPVPAIAPATDVAGAAMLVGYWFGKTDASVFLDEQVTAAQRGAVLRRLQSLDVVDAVYFESREDAHARLKALYRNKPSLADVDPRALPASFRVRLDAPDHFARLERALCSRPVRKAGGDAPCMAGVEAVLQDTVPLKAVLVPKAWATRSDATVYLPAGVTGAKREVVRTQVAAIDGVARVIYESPEAAYRRLPEKLRRDARDPAKVTPPFSPESIPAAFHVALDEPGRAGEFHRALCGSRKTGACGGLVVLEHPRRR